MALSTLTQIDHHPQQRMCRPHCTAFLKRGGLLATRVLLPTHTISGLQRNIHQLLNSCQHKPWHGRAKLLCFLRAQSSASYREGKALSLSFTSPCWPSLEISLPSRWETGKDVPRHMAASLIPCPPPRARDDSQQPWTLGCSALLRAAGIALLPQPISCLQTLSIFDKVLAWLPGFHPSPEMGGGTAGSAAPLLPPLQHPHLTPR